MILLLIQGGGKISLCVDFRNKGKNYRVQVFKTNARRSRMDRTFIVFFAYCCVIFVPVSVLFCITFHPLNDRHFKVFQVSATECSKCSVVLLFRP